MNFFRLFFVVIIILIAEIFISCCECDPVQDFYYTNCDLAIENIDNSGTNIKVTPSNEIPRSTYGIKFTIQGMEDQCSCNYYNGMFSSPLYATTCDCPYDHQYHALDSMVNIEIITANKFDAEHLENSDITDYFHEYNELANTYSPLGNFIDTLTTTIYSYGTADFIGHEFYTLLMTPPETGTEHQFIIKIYLSDGRILEKQTELLKLL